MVSPRHADGDALYERGEGTRSRRHRGQARRQRVRARASIAGVAQDQVPPAAGVRRRRLGARRRHPRVDVRRAPRRRLRRARSCSYSGRVGTGFKERELQRLLGRFRELASDECPFDPPPPPPTRKIAHWVRPEMVVEVAVRRVDARQHPPPAVLPRRARRQEPPQGRPRDLTGRQRPVWPKPPPRFSPSSVSTSRNAQASTRWMTSCAMRSPRCTSIRLGRVGVDEQHLELVAVPGVDETGRVQQRDAVPQREPAARLHEAGVPDGDGDRDARRHERPAAARRERRILASAQVGAGVALSGVATGAAARDRAGRRARRAVRASE